MPVYTRHNEVLVLDSKPSEVDAHYFNVVQYKKGLVTNDSHLSPTLFSPPTSKQWKAI